MENCIYLSAHYDPFYPNIVFVRGNGSRVWDTEGNEYLDFASGESFFNFGRRHPLIDRAMIAEIQDGLVQMCGCNFWYPSQARLAQMLCETMPKRYQWRVFFTNSGAESIEGAMKLAQYVTGRPAFVAFRGCFHGRTLGALNLTNSNPVQRKGFFLTIPVEHLAFGALRALDNIHRSDIAAVFVEPIQGYGGVRVAPPGFLKRIREFCDEHRALMVVDEIQTGLGRTGTMWAFEHDEIVPDVICSAKALGGGLPLGAVIAKAPLMEIWERGAHGSSGGGNVVACAAGTAVLSLLHSENCLRYVRDTGQLFIQQLQEALPRTTVTGRGFMVGVEFASRDIREAVMREAGKQGLLVVKASRNFRDSSIRLLPPLNAFYQELVRSISIISESFASLSV